VLANILLTPTDCVLCDTLHALPTNAHVPCHACFFTNRDTATQGAGAVCQTVCMPYTNNSSSNTNTTVHSSLSLLVTTADAVDYYSTLASDVPWYISAHVIQGTDVACNDTTDDSSNSVSQLSDAATQTLEWQDAASISIDTDDSINATLIDSNCDDNQQPSGYTLQTVKSTTFTST
jgi:hypothetical protein